MRERRGAPRRLELGRIERLVAIRSFADWSDLPGPEIALLASIARSRVVPSGSRLLEAGRPVGSMFLVVDGELSVRRGEVETRVGKHGLAGATFALADDPQGCECIAVQDSVVLEIAADDLEDVFEDHPTVLVRTVSRVAREALALRVAVPDPRPSRERKYPPPGPDAPLDLVQRILVLRRTRGLSGASIDGIAALASVAREIRAPADHVLWRAGDASEALLVVVGGMVKATTPAGRRFVAGPFELVGDLDCLACEPRAHDAIAGAPLVALAIERDAMLDAWEDHLDLGTELLRWLSRSVLALGASPSPA